MAEQLARGILIDTSVLIEHFRSPSKQKSWLTALAESDTTLAVSSISVFELLCGATDRVKRDYLERLLSQMRVLSLDEAVARTAARLFVELRRSGHAIPPTDLLIGATAIYYDMPIASLNRVHFDRIPDICLAAEKR